MAEQQEKIASGESEFSRRVFPDVGRESGVAAGDRQRLGGRRRAVHAGGAAAGEGTRWFGQSQGRGISRGAGEAAIGGAMLCNQDLCKLFLGSGPEILQLREDHSCATFSDSRSSLSAEGSHAINF